MHEALVNNNNQLTFSDDPFLPQLNNVFSLIESGEFTDAVTILDKLLEEKPDYPGIAEAYRTARFWQNRLNELNSFNEGKNKADFYMNEWSNFTSYSEEKNIIDSNAYKSAQKYVFFTAAEHYKIAFQKQQAPTDNFDLLINLGICFLTLGEFKHAVETLEYARSSYKVSTKLLSILAEAYYHNGEVPKSLLLFREAFFINPSEIDMKLLKAKPIHEIINIIETIKPNCSDVREWIPIIGHVVDIFYVKKNINNQQVETIKKDIFSLEHNFQMMSEEQINSTNIMPRLLNKYLWLYDYFQFQKYDFENLTEIRSRLIKIDRELFEDYFKNKKD